MGLNLTASISIIGDYTATAGVAAEDAHVNVAKAIQFLTGAGVNQADTVYSEAINIAASGSQTLDLATGLTDALGVAVNLTRVKGIVVIADPGNINNIVLGNAGSNPFTGPLGGTTPTVETNPGGITALIAPDATGWVVGSGVNIKLANSSSGSAVTGKIIIWGSNE